MVHCLDGGGGRPQHHKSLFLDSPPQRHLSGTVPGVHFRFIGVLLFLVQNDEPQGFAGGKHRRTGANHHSGLSPADPVPLVIPLAFTEAAVKHRHQVLKPGGKQSQKLGGQSDLRNQKHGASAPVQTFLNEPDINRCFSRAGDAVQQGSAGGLPPHLLQKAFKALLLLFIKNQWPIQGGRFDFTAPEHRPLAQGQVAQLFQPVHRGGRGAGIVENILHRRAANAAQQFQHAFLHGRAFGAGSGKIHGFLGADRKRSDLFGSVPGSPDILLFPRDPLLLQQVGKHAAQPFLVGDYLAQRHGIRRTAQLLQPEENPFGPFLPRLPFLPAPVIGQ